MSEIACIAVPRFALVAACGQRRVDTEPLALLRGNGPGATVTEVSPRAEARGIRTGMSRSQALALCRELRPATPDPLAAEELWAQVLGRLEAFGAAVEPGRPGEAFFRPAGLTGLHGGGVTGVLVTARRAMPLRVRSAAAPARFASFVAAVIDRRRAPGIGRRGERIVAEAAVGAFLAALPTGALTVGPGLGGREAAELVDALEMLGVETLGELAALGADHLADRFGATGLAALRIARGEDRELRPREMREELAEELELPDGAGSGAQLEAGLEILVARLLEQPERRRRTVLAVRLGARLAGGGSWSARQALGRPSASAPTIASLLRRRLGELPGPPTALSLRVTALGPPDADQLRLPETGVREGAERLEEAIRQLGVLQGPEAILDLVEVDPASRLPERRWTLLPYSPDRRARRPPRSGGRRRG